MKNNDPRRRGWRPVETALVAVSRDPEDALSVIRSLGSSRGLTDLLVDGPRGERVVTLRTERAQALLCQAAQFAA